MAVGLEHAPPAIWLAVACVALLPATTLTSALALGVWLRRFGPSAICWTTGWFGVPVHEGSHWLMCKLLGRKVVAVRWFEPDLQAGTLGRVDWVAGTGPVAWLTAAAVGLAPLAGGVLALHGLAQLAGYDGLSRAAHALQGLQSPQELAEVAQGLAGSVAAKGAQACHGPLTTMAALVAWLWTSACVATHLSPSRADLAMAWRGVVLVAGGAVLVDWGLQAVGVSVHEPLLSGVATVAAWTLPALALALASLAGLGLVGWWLALLLPSRR